MSDAKCFSPDFFQHLFLFFQGQEQKKEQGAIKGRKKKVDRINVEKYHLNDSCPNPKIPEVIFVANVVIFPGKIIDWKTSQTPCGYFPKKFKIVKNPTSK